MTIRRMTTRSQLLRPQVGIDKWSNVQKSVFGLRRRRGAGVGAGGVESDEG